MIEDTLRQRVPTTELPLVKPDLNAVILQLVGELHNEACLVFAGMTDERLRRLFHTGHCSLSVGSDHCDSALVLTVPLLTGRGGASKLARGHVNSVARSPSNVSANFCSVSSDLARHLTGRRHQFDRHRRRDHRSI